MEPERQIEKLLRAFAKKRRTGGQDAFKLQPWVRRRLQDEVSKQLAGPDEESLSLWQLFRRQWALFVGFALFIFLGASLFVPALSASKQKAKSVAAMNQLREIGTAAQMAAAENNGRLPATLDTLTNGYLNRDALTDPSSGKPFVYAAGGAILDGLGTNGVLAYSTETKNNRTVLFADGSVRLMNEKAFDSLNLSSLKPDTGLMLLAANTPAPTVAPPASTMTLQGNNAVEDDFAAKEPSTLADQSIGLKIAAARTIGTAPTTHKPGLFFANKAASDVSESAFYFQTTNTLPALAQDGPKIESQPSVLAAFELRQNGDAITIVDRDGSVYNGTITPDSITNQSVGGLVLAVAADKDQWKPGVHFRVSGESQSFKKSVVFVGAILSASNNVVTNNVAGLGTLPGARITGTATIDATNIIRVDAVPVAP